MRASSLRRLLTGSIVLISLLYLTRIRLISKHQICDHASLKAERYPMLIINHSDVSPSPKSALLISILLSPASFECADRVIIVHSHWANLNERRRLRDVFQSADMKILFVVGRDGGNLASTTLREESQHFDDLLVIDIEEHYHHITYKAQAWIRYLYERCSNLRWIVKIDDDVEANRYLIDILLDKYRHYSRVLLGKVYLNNRVMRNNASKWYLSKSEYDKESLGAYLQGMSYIISGDLLPSMSVNIGNVQYLWMDDWYVTHALLNGTLATLIDISPLVASINSREELEKMMESRRKIAFMHLRPKEDFPPAERIRIWRELKADCAK